MRRLGTLIAYWVLAGAAVLALFGLGLNTRLLAPLGRVLLFDRANGWRDLRNGRRWAEAVGLTLVWGGVPWLIDLIVGRRLMDAGIRLFWMPGMDAWGSGAWWWIGVAASFGLLHRRALAALIGGVFALVWQWAVMGAELVPALRPLIPSDVVSGYLVFALFMGLMLGVADFLGGHIGARPKSRAPSIRVEPPRPR